MQDPVKVPLGLFVDNRMIICWAVAWWLLNHFPGGLPGRVCSYWPIKVGARVVVCVCVCAGQAR